LEAEVTGGLEHPNIVPVYGLGTYGDGRPYYAMRLIRGDSLKDAIKRFHTLDDYGPRDFGERSLALRKLLGRFIDVCNAMAYAHSRGVLHRDLKPGNIMLGKYGETLVVDWGLAKPTDRADIVQVGAEPTLRPSSGSGLQATVAGSAIGTPAYMSPEQASGDASRLGPASDVYSLGATLYCVLTGKAPYDDEDIRALLKRVQRGEFLSPRVVQPDVPRALEAICLKAMSLQPADRYVTPRALADDIEHWLADEPVSAHREGWVARLARWARRHRALVLGGAATLTVALVAAVVLAIQQSRAADREHQIAKRERVANDLAQARLIQVERGSDLIASIFHDIDPREEEKEGKSLRAILGDRIDGVVGQLEGELISDPLTVAKLQARLGAAQLNLGHPERSVALHSAALQTQQETLGPDHPDTLNSRSNLAEAYRFTGRSAEAVAMEEETLRLRTTKLGPNHPDTLNSRDNLAESYRDVDRIAEAIAMHEETLKLRAAKLGPDHRDTLSSRSNLANAYLAADRTAEAIAIHEETLRLSSAALGPDFIDTLSCRVSLAAAYRIAGRTTDAIELNEETLTLSAAKLGPDHPISLVTRINLGRAYRIAGRIDAAIEMNEETFRLGAAKFGPDHPNTLASRSNLAESYFAAGRAAEAIELDEATFKMRVDKLGSDHRDTQRSRINLAVAYESIGRWSDAEPLRRERVAFMQKTEPAGSLPLANDLGPLGHNLLQQEKWSEAEPVLRECLKILDASHSEDWSRFNTMSMLGAALVGQERYDEAEPLIVDGYEGLKERETTVPRRANLPYLPEAARRAIRLYEAWGKPEKAAEWKEKLSPR
jgi:tetratricopeptide (TPR) repeat protein